MEKYIINLLLSFGLSLALVILIMPRFINLLKSLNYNQEVSEYALEEYKKKAATPIMGGLLFVVIPIIVALVVDYRIIFDPSALMIILSFVLFCLVGFIDDYIIIVQKNNNGLSPKLKMLMQLIFAFVLFVGFKNHIDTNVAIPLTNINIPLGILYGLFMVFVYAAESNAVNFTDGMDGLCAGVSFISLIPFLVFALIDHEYYIATIITSVLGGLLAYLKFNFFPAKVFMGDSGSLALGALFTAIAIALERELLLVIVGGVFVWEMVCVCLQQFSVRVFHKRIFRYTPIHYAFVLRGMKEKRVVLMFYMIAFIFSIIGLMIGVL